MSYTRQVSGKMMLGHHVRFLFVISLALQMIHLGNSYQREIHGSGKEAINNATIQERHQKTLNRILNNFSDANGSLEGWRQPRESLPHSWGFQESESRQRSCCQNGGTCVLGSFCVCSAHFTGRHCEQDRRLSVCGAQAHGVWTVRGCRLCRCIYGALHCLAHKTQGLCGKETSAFCCWHPHVAQQLLNYLFITLVDR
ncbi:cryptic family protein 1B [Orycteropus afer afer]|uniref:Cryptic family protein 1B n=1 Tax=Orycteropus afer afer TaxID=1230840 RepID=A0A8B7AL31_ORYAF|nr:cryptic family protein 1B [Orycteropus afer afer]